MPQTDSVDPIGVSTLTVGYNGDMLGSTMLVTDQNGGTAVSWSAGYQPVVSYIAFGDPTYRDASGVEHVGPLPADANPPDFPRYQYAGGWGYENGYITLQGANMTLAPITLQHVGWRWYQPGIGRFVQRDPAGIEGGVNVYSYVNAFPSARVDPEGLYWDYDDIVHRDGSTTRHFYDRGWFGWKNDYQYSVTIPAGRTPPFPPRTIDQRCVSIAKSTALGVDIGAGRGLIGGICTGTPEGIIVGTLGEAAVGGLTGFIGGVLKEMLD